MKAASAAPIANEIALLKDGMSDSEYRRATDERGFS